MDWKKLWEVLKTFYFNNALVIWIVLGVTIGISIGLIMKAIQEDPYSPRIAMYVGFLGETFLRLLKGIALPLMSACIINAFAKIDRHISKNLAFQLVPIIVFTKLLCVILAISLALISKYWTEALSPEEEDIIVEEKHLTIVDIFLDLIRNIFPSNIIEMFTHMYVTEIVPGASNNKYDWDFQGIMKSGINLLGIVSTSIALGVALRSLNESSSSHLKDFISSVLHSTFTITKWIILASPIFLVSLVAGQIIKVKSFEHLLAKIGIYLLCSIAAQLLVMFVLYPLVYFILVRKNPYRVIFGVLETLTMAFATTSSIACIPIAIKNLEEKVKVDSRIAQFVIPLGININKDGAATSLAIQVIFVAQMTGSSFSFGQTVSLLFLASAASIAVAGVPHAVLISLIILLESLGLPQSPVGYILAVDFIRDRFSTPNNVLGNCFLADILYNINRKQFDVDGNEETET